MGKIKGIFRRIFFGKRKKYPFKPKSYDSFRINDLEGQVSRLEETVRQLMSQLNYTQLGNVVMKEIEAKKFRDKGIYPPNAL